MAGNLPWQEKSCKKCEKKVLKNSQFQIKVIPLQRVKEMRC